MADWGADVIKIETPGGDPMRRVFAVALAAACSPRARRSTSTTAGSEASCSTCAPPRTVETLRRLLATADVFLTNLRPDALERLGLDHRDRSRRIPASSSTPASPATDWSGPDRLRPGYDVGAFCGAQRSRSSARRRCRRARRRARRHGRPRHIDHRAVRHPGRRCSTANAPAKASSSPRRCCVPGSTASAGSSASRCGSASWRRRSRDQKRPTR